MNLTIERAERLRGKELDKAVSELVYQCQLHEATHVMSFRDCSMIPEDHFLRGRVYPFAVYPCFSRDLRLVPLAFEGGGPLSPTENSRFHIVWAASEIAVERWGWADADAHAVPGWCPIKTVATGPDLPTAVWRAALVMTLERERRTG